MFGGMTGGEGSARAAGAVAGESRGWFVALTAALLLSGLSYGQPKGSPGASVPTRTDSPTASASAMQAKPVTINVQKDLDLEFVRVPPGSFMMGSDGGRLDICNVGFKENGAGPGRQSSNYYPDRPAHRVTFESGFTIGKYEITNDQWTKVMRGVEVSSMMVLKGGPKAAVGGVSWTDAQRFVRRLNELLPGNGFSLPTEEQWEYACRAGSTTMYSFGDDPARLDEYAWLFDPRIPGDPRKPVGLKKPNAWGIHDMHGNAPEWCLNAYTLYPGNPARDMWLEFFHHIGRQENAVLAERATLGERGVARRMETLEAMVAHPIRGGPDILRGSEKNLVDVYASARRAPVAGLFGDAPGGGCGFRLVCYGFVELPVWKGVPGGTLPEKTAGVSGK